LSSRKRIVLGAVIAGLALLAAVIVGTRSGGRLKDKAGAPKSGPTATEVDGSPSTPNVPVKAVASGPQSSAAPNQVALPLPIKLASGQNRPLDLRLDSENIYWINSGRNQRGTGEVVKASKAGGQVTVLAGGEDVITGIDVDGASVYWTSMRGVFKVPKAGGGPVTELHHAEKGAGGPTIVAARPPIVYVGITHFKADLGGLYTITSKAKGDGEVYKLPLHGTGVATPTVPSAAGPPTPQTPPKDDSCSHCSSQREAPSNRGRMGVRGQREGWASLPLGCGRDWL